MTPGSSETATSFSISGVTNRYDDASYTYVLPSAPTGFEYVAGANNTISGNTLTFNDPTDTTAIDVDYTFNLQNTDNTANVRTYTVAVSFGDQLNVDTFAVDGLIVTTDGYTGGTAAVGSTGVVNLINRSNGIYTVDLGALGDAFDGAEYVAGTNTTLSGTTLTLIDTDDTGVGVNNATYTFILREVAYPANSSSYDISAAFSAQQSTETLVAADIMATYSAGTPTVGEITGGFEITGLINRLGGVDGSVTVTDAKLLADFNDASLFEIVTNATDTDQTTNLALDNPDGITAINESVGSFIVREKLYLSNSITYAVTADFADGSPTVIDSINYVYTGTTVEDGTPTTVNKDSVSNEFAFTVTNRDFTGVTATTTITLPDISANGDEYVITSTGDSLSGYTIEIDDLSDGEAADNQQVIEFDVQEAGESGNSTHYTITVRFSTPDEVSAIDDITYVYTGTTAIDGTPTTVNKDSVSNEFAFTVTNRDFTGVTATTTITLPDISANGDEYVITSTGDSLSGYTIEIDDLSDGEAADNQQVIEFDVQEVNQPITAIPYEITVTFEAQATVPTLEASDIEASFTGSSPTVGLASTTLYSWYIS